MPHFTFLELAALIGLRAFWLAPDWGIKVMKLADAIKRFRR
jgi:hypothetical protein